MTMCRPGSRTNKAIAATTCSPCDSGHFSLTVSSQCDPCPAGTWSPSGQMECKPCEEGTFAEKNATSVCSVCPVTTFSVEGASSCTLAEEGYYLDVNGESIECPSTAECQGGDATPRPKRGFWVEREDMKYAGAIYRCSRRTCKGAGNDVVSDFCWSRKSFNVSDGSCNAGVLQCHDGASGPLCGFCAMGYSFSSAQQICMKCGEVGLQGFILLSVGVLAAAASAATYAGKLRLPSCIMQSRILSSAKKINGGACRIIFATLQIIQSVSWNLDMVLPEPFSSFLNILSIFSLDFVSVSCIFQNTGYIASVIVWALVPIVILLLIVTSFILRHCFARGDNPRIRRVALRHATWALLFSFVVIPPVGLKLLQALSCIKIAGSSYLRTDTSVDCGSRVYQYFVVVDILFLCLYLSMPLLMFALLYRERRKLDPLQSDDTRALFLRDNDESIAHLRFLFSEFRIGWYAVEPLELFRRIFFIGVLPLTSSKSSLKAAFGMLFALSSGVFYREAEPYVSPANNILVVFAQHSIFLTFGVALAIEIGLTRGASGRVLGGVLLGVNLAFLLLAVGIGARSAYERRTWKAINPLSSQELILVEDVMAGREVGNIGSEKGLEMKTAGKKVASDAQFNRALKQHQLRASDIVLVRRVGAGERHEISVFSATSPFFPHVYQAPSPVETFSFFCFRGLWRSFLRDSPGRGGGG